MTTKSGTVEGPVTLDDAFDRIEQMTDWSEYIDLVCWVSGQDVEFRVHYRCGEGNIPRNVVVNIAISSITGGFVTMLTNQAAAASFGTTAGVRLAIEDLSPVETAYYIGANDLVAAVEKTVAR